MKLILLFLGLTYGVHSMAQSQLDTLIGLRKTEVIRGKVPTFYSPGNKGVAKDYQKTITQAITYFEKKYNKVFNVKLAVLDSTQWLNEIVPFGLIFYSDGWIVLNAGMDFKKFADMYGLNAKYAEMQLKREKVKPTAFITQVFKFYSIHELGHYFIAELSNAKPPDNWTNEFVPTYLAFDFFRKEQNKELKGMELFSLAIKDHYSPAYLSLESFNEKYVGVGIPNYVWYHSNFYFLAKELFNCKGTNFFSDFEQTFTKNHRRKYTTKEIIGVLETGCAGVVTVWVNEMAPKAKK